MNEPFDLPLMSESQARKEVATIMTDVIDRIPERRFFLRGLMLERARKLTKSDSETWASFLLPGSSSFSLLAAFAIIAFILNDTSLGWHSGFLAIAYLVAVIGFQYFVLSGAKAYWLNRQDTDCLKNVLGNEILSASTLDYSEYGICSVKANDIILKASISASMLNRLSKAPYKLFNYFDTDIDNLFSLWEKIDDTLDVPLWKLEKELKGTVTTMKQEASS